MAAYYNEHDERAAAWLRELIAAGEIADGDVDTRSILDVTPRDLRGFTQCHFFAGIGGWSLALRLAGWPDDRHVWTGSCPCQPFSAAGAGAGGADERHLWPAWFWLIDRCRPAVVVGEQVEAAIKFGWIDLVHDDLEGIGYAVASVGLPAAGVGAFHIRQRLWFVADTASKRRQHEQAILGVNEAMAGEAGSRVRVSSSRDDGVVAESDRTRYARHGSQALLGGRDRQGPQSSAHGCRADDELADCHGAGLGSVRWSGSNRERYQGRDADDREPTNGTMGVDVSDSGFWHDVIWLPCRDGKARPTQPGLQPLAHGVPGRVGLLRGAGNAIVPQLAAEFIEAYCDVRTIEGGSNAEHET